LAAVAAAITVVKWGAETPGEASERAALASVTVVVPCLDAGAALDEQLAALAAQDYGGGWEVIVADNGSTDGSRERVLAWRGRLPNLRVVDAAQRRGVNHARNAGVAAASGDVVLICDADDRVAPGWVAAMVAAFRSGNDLVGGFLEEGGLNRSRPAGGHDGLADWAAFLPWATGANCGFRAQVHKALGGFDEAYDAGGGDDTEFFWRAQLAGFRLGYVPDAVVHYRLRAGTRALARQYYRYGRAMPRLYRQFRVHGMPANDLSLALRAWAVIAARLPDLVRDSGRRQWIKMAAHRLGRLHGSIEQHVLYL
jgi:glycosyltransferase involved in cell wall biosynthesis